MAVSAFTIFCQHGVPNVASSVAVLFKGPRKKCQITAVADGKLLADPTELVGFFSHTVTIQDTGKPHHVRVLGLDNKKKVISSISQRVV
jgi:hypothetical protein